MPRFDDYTGADLIPPYRVLDLTDRRARSAVACWPITVRMW